MDEQIRKNYGQASPGDLMPGFDREALWGEIATRMEKPAGKRIFLRWGSYAAAAVAGALLMLLLQPGKEREQILSATRLLPQQEQVSLPPTIMPLSPDKESTPNPVAAVTGKAPKPVIAAGKAPEPAASTIAQAALRPEPAPIAAVLTDTIGPRHVVAGRLPVKHLLELGNEDRRLIDDGSFPGGPGSRIIELNKPGSSNGAQPDLAFRRLFNAGND